MNPQGRRGDTRWMISTSEPSVGARAPDPTWFPEAGMDILATYNSPLSVSFAKAT